MDLGLGDAEFWRLTPRQFDALVRRWIAREQREDRRAAVTAAVLANIYRKPHSRALTLDDFLVHRWGAPGDAADGAGHRQTQTPEYQIALMQAMTTAQGGTTGTTDSPASEGGDDHR